MGSRTRARNHKRSVARRKNARGGTRTVEAHELTPSQVEARAAMRPRRLPGDGRDWSSEDTHEFANHVALRTGAWSGVPMPVDGFAFVLEPNYPNRAALTEVLDRVQEVDPVARLSALRREQRGITCRTEDVGALRIRNRWRGRRGIVWLYETEAEPGRVRLLLEPHGADTGRRLTLLMTTIGASTGWDPRAEERAVDKLRQLVRPHLFEMYRMTGCLLETSRRSGVTYIVRRLRPTVALVPWDRTNPRSEDLPMRCLGTLCLHPVGYYADTFAGGMVPTDDVIAHLLLIRGDEHMFWRKANVHATWEPEAGL